MRCKQSTRSCSNPLLYWDVYIPNKHGIDFYTRQSAMRCKQSTRSCSNPLLYWDVYISNKHGIEVNCFVEESVTDHDLGNQYIGESQSFRNFLSRIVTVMVRRVLEYCSMPFRVWTFWPVSEAQLYFPTFDLGCSRGENFDVSICPSGAPMWAWVLVWGNCMAQIKGPLIEWWIVKAKKTNHLPWTAVAKCFQLLVSVSPH